MCSMLVWIFCVNDTHKQVQYCETASLLSRSEKSACANQTDSLHMWPRCLNAEAEGCKLIFLWRLLNAENVDVCSNSKLVHSHTCVAREKLYGDFGFETALILKEKDIKDFKNAVLPRSVCVRVGIRNFAKSRVCLTSFDKDNYLTSHHISSS